MKPSSQLLTSLLWGLLAISGASLAVTSLPSENGNLMAALLNPQGDSGQSASTEGIDQARLETMLLQSRMLEHRVSRLDDKLTSLEESNNLVLARLETDSERLQKIEETFDSITASIAPVSEQPTTVQQTDIEGQGMPLPSIKPSATAGELNQQYKPLATESGPMASVANSDVAGVMPDRQDILSAPPATNVRQTDFAITIARGSDIEALIQSWMDLNEIHGAALSGLQTRVKIEKAENSRIELVLVAGPLRNASDAAALCFEIDTFDKGCKPVVFSGDPLPPT